MARDPLDIVIRLRQSALEETRRHLTECLAAEDQAAAVVAALETEAARQRLAAESLSASDATVEGYATWLARHRAARERGQANLDRAASETTRARAALTAARAALEAAEALRDSRLAEARATAARAEQHALDDISRSRDGSTG